MVRMKFSFGGLALLLGLIYAFPAHADEDRSTVFTFANGLENKGFYDLAAEQFLALARDEKASEHDRAEAASRLGECYRKAADAADKPEARDALLRTAGDQFAALSKTFRNGFYVWKAVFAVGLINQRRALDRDRQIKATQDPKLQAKLKAEAVRLFADAASVFEEVSGRLEPMLKKPPERDRPPPFLQEILEQFLLARGQLGWTHYYCGALLSRFPADEDQANREYQEAQKVLESFLAQYPNYLISLWAKCGLGLVYRCQGEMTKAIKEFQYVRAVNRWSPIRLRAWAWLIETYRLNGQYSEGLHWAALFFQRDAESFPKSDRHAIRLEEAKIYAERAQAFEKDHRISEALEDYKKAFSITGDIIREGVEDQSEVCKLRIGWAQRILADTAHK